MIDTEIKRQIKLLQSCISFLKLYPPKNMNTEVGEIYSLLKKYEDQDLLFTEKTMDELIDFYNSLNLPELDLVNEVQLIVTAAGSLIQSKQLTKDQVENIKYEIDELKSNGVLYTDRGVEKLQYYWEKYKLPNLNLAQNKLIYSLKNLSQVTPETLKSNGVDISTFSDFKRNEFINDIKFIQDFTKKEVKFYPASSNRENDLSDLPTSSKNLVTSYFQRFQKLTDLTPVLEER